MEYIHWISQYQSFNSWYDVLSQCIETTIYIQDILFYPNTFVIMYSVKFCIMWQNRENGKPLEKLNSGQQVITPIYPFQGSFTSKWLKLYFAIRFINGLKCLRDGTRS